MESQANSQQTKPVEPKVNELIAECKSLILATVDADGNPTASYAPFARLGNKFFILVSYMARHTKNLKEIGKVSAMFIEDESASKQIYARHRLTLDVSTREIERDTTEWSEAVTELQTAHGKILDILVGMQDFIMIELTTKKGAYVNGFGSAYFVDENLEILQHRNDINHQVAEKSSK
ncbi:Pyridoxamine 5'-phosphate oxidase [compost metagenome]